jgi:hypothetical protein
MAGWVSAVRLALLSLALLTGCPERASDEVDAGPVENWCRGGWVSGIEERQALCAPRRVVRP